MRPAVACVPGQGEVRSAAVWERQETADPIPLGLSRYEIDRLTVFTEAVTPAQSGAAASIVFGYLVRHRRSGET